MLTRRDGRKHNTAAPHSSAPDPARDVWAGHMGGELNCMRETERAAI